MAAPALTLESLPAGYGDSLLISCPVGRKTWRLLIDTGPDECLPVLKERLRQLPQDTSGRRLIDLAVISHIDHDHIGGAAALFADESLRLSFGDIWFNAPSRAPTRGVAEGVGLAAVLGAAAHGLAWNLAMGGGDVVTTADLFLEMPRKRGEPRITLLSPTRKSLDALYAVWAKELPTVKLRPEAPQPILERGGFNVEELASRATTTDRAPANGSSIAFLLEHRGATALLTADAHPTVLVPALRSLAARRGQSLPWVLDLIKLSHHGSRANTTVELMEVVRARDYVVSTNGAIFGHPDPEGVARVALGGPPGRRIWFNYRNERTQRWADLLLCQRYGYEARYPDAGRGNVIVISG